MTQTLQTLPAGTRVDTPNGVGTVYLTSDFMFIPFDGEAYYEVLVAFRPTHITAGIKRAYRSTSVTALAAA